MQLRIKPTIIWTKTEELNIQRKQQLVHAKGGSNQYKTHILRKERKEIRVKLSPF